MASRYDTLILRIRSDNPATKSVADGVIHGSIHQVATGQTHYFGTLVEMVDLLKDHIDQLEPPELVEGNENEP